MRWMLDMLAAGLDAKAPRRIGRLGRDEGGMAAVEFALIAPIMFFLLVGTVELSQALTVDRRVTQAASSTADLVARAPSTGLTTAQVDGELTIIRQLMRPYSYTPLTVQINSVYAKNPSAGNALIYLVSWSRDSGGGTPLATGTTYTGIPEGLLAAGESVIIGKASYTYTPLVFSFFIQNAITMNETFYLKPRNATCVTLQPTQCVTS